jgi:hypothetical protein
LKPIIYSLFKILFAPDVPLGGLHRCVTQQGLNLFEFASCLMAEAGTCATKIVGSEMVKADSFGISLHGVPDYVGFHSINLSSTVLRNSPEHLTLLASNGAKYQSNIYTSLAQELFAVFPPSRVYRRSPSGFAAIAIDPTSSSRFRSVANHIRAAVRSLQHLFSREGCVEK